MCVCIMKISLKIYKSDTNKVFGSNISVFIQEFYHKLLFNPWEVSDLKRLSLTAKSDHDNRQFKLPKNNTGAIPSTQPPRGVMVKALNCRIIVSLNFSSAIMFTFWKGMYPLIPSNYRLNSATIVLLQGWIWH